MKDQTRKSRSFRLMGYVLSLLLMFGGLAGGRVAAAGPLPLPDLLIYGTVVNTTGDQLQDGTLKALLNGQTIASTTIRPISGAGYNFMLTVPVGMYAPNSTVRSPKLAFAGDTLSFTVDGQPVYYQDPLTSLTVDQIRIPSGAAGKGLVLDLKLGDAMRYLLGDANANGARNATDAMLALKYDIGLIIGVTSFPPGPNTVYLPLCDIVENGRCDSSDALRILQCDAGLTNVACPMQTIPAVGTGPMTSTAFGDGAPTQADQGADESANRIRLQVKTGEIGDDSHLDVSVLLAEGADHFGAASFDLEYDPTRLTPSSCAADPGEVLALVVCNLDYAPGIVRFNAVAIQGAADGTPLVTLRFQSTDATDKRPVLKLTVGELTDVKGHDMIWDFTPADGTEIQRQIFLPVIVAPEERPANQPAPETEEVQEAQQSFFLPFITVSATVSASDGP